MRVKSRNIKEVQVKREEGRCEKRGTREVKGGRGREGGRGEGQAAVGPSGIPHLQ